MKRWVMDAINKYEDRWILFEQSLFTAEDKVIEQRIGRTGEDPTWQKVNANGNKGLGSGRGGLGDWQRPGR